MENCVIQIRVKPNLKIRLGPNFRDAFFSKKITNLRWQIYCIFMHISILKQNVAISFEIQHGLYKFHLSFLSIRFQYFCMLWLGCVFSLYLLFVYLGYMYGFSLGCICQGVPGLYLGFCTWFSLGVYLWHMYFGCTWGFVLGLYKCFVFESWMQ